MGRLESVRLQVRVAEVWLVTTGGSALMFGTLDKERSKCEALILTIATCLTLLTADTQQWSPRKTRADRTDRVLSFGYKSDAKS